MLRTQAYPFPQEFVEALTFWFHSSRSSDALQTTVALGAGLPAPPTASVLVGAWPAFPSSPRPSSGSLLVFLTRLGPLRMGRFPLSGFIRATLASGRILFQLRAPPIRHVRPLTELAPLACFLLDAPLLSLHFLDFCTGHPLSLVPTLPDVSWAPFSPLLDASFLTACDSVPPFPCSSV